jgi:hypothetical protein
MTAAEVLVKTAADGVSLKLDGARLTWSADHLPTLELLAEIKAHRLEIIETFRAASDHGPRRPAWRITCDGKPICMMVGEPMTYAEALEAARWHWPDAQVQH